LFIIIFTTASHVFISSQSNPGRTFTHKFLKILFVQSPSFVYVFYELV